MDFSSTPTWDLQILRSLNSGLAHYQIDHTALLLSSTWLWWAVLAVIATIAAYKRRLIVLRSATAMVAALVVTDVLCGQIIKPWVARERPCVYDREVVRVVAEKCGGRYGFPSNHAANGMALTAAAVALGFGPWALALGLITLIVGASRIYLGVHYPTDVLAGFCIGGMIGWLAGRVASIGKVKYPWRQFGST